MTNSMTDQHDAYTGKIPPPMLIVPITAINNAHEKAWNIAKDLVFKNALFYLKFALTLQDLGS